MDSDWSRITVWQVDFRFSSENLARIAVHHALSTIYPPGKFSIFAFETRSMGA
jgi:hypothetical protein